MAGKRIAITLPPEVGWLGLVQQAVSRFGEEVGFPPTLISRLAGATLEAWEELIRVSAAVGSKEPLRLGLELKGEAVVVEIEYDGVVPLNPHQAEEYEFPIAGGDQEDVDSASLWLHLLKNLMDRVYYLVRGPRRVLRMVKYGRKEGQELRAWVMALRPRLKKGLHLHLKGTNELHPSSVLENPFGHVLVLGPSETFIVRRLDGKTEMHDIYMAHVDELGLVSPAALTTLYERLEANGMLADQDGDARRSGWRRVLRKLVNPDISIPRADALVSWAYARTRFLFSRAGLATLLVLGLSGAIPAWLHFEQFMTLVGDLEETLIARPIILLPLYLLLVMHALLHELAHGAVCKHYGGQVPRLGIMFYLGSFIFYCDTTAAWNFPLKRQRLLVSLGGPILSFAILGAGLWATGALAGGGSLWATVWVAFSLLNFFCLAASFNPLIKMDAYYMLVDIIEIPNLRTRSFRFLARRLLGWLGLGEDKDLATTPRERKVFWWYGVLGGLETVFFLVIPVAKLVQLWQVESDSQGRIVLAGFVCALVLARLGSQAFDKVKAMRQREYRLT